MNTNALTAVESAHVAVVKVTNVTKRYAAITAVDDLSFSLQPGTVTGFLGPNGAGKTTTLRMLLGLVNPTRGSVLINDVPYARLDDPCRRVGAVLESNDFHPARSGRNHLRVLAAAATIPTPRVDDMLELVGLTDAAQRPVKSYSLGMRQRLGLAGALLGRPALLVLDEPANGLDPEGVRWLRDLLRRFATDGGTVLMSSHMLAEVAQTVDRVLVITGGKLVADTPVGELARAGQTLEDAYVRLTRAAPATEPAA